MMKINLIGKERNIGWGMEGLVQRALQYMGHEVTFADSLGMAPDWNAPAERWVEEQPPLSPVLTWLPAADLNLVIQGYGLSPEAIDWLRERTQAPVVLWHGEVLGDHWPTDDEVVYGKVEQLSQNIGAYDLVCHNCATSLSVLKELGAKKVCQVSVSGVDLEVHQRFDVPKVIDLLIYGWSSERRYAIVKEIVDQLVYEQYVSARPNIVYYWPLPDAGYYGQALTHLINTSRCVLNVHYSSTLNVETRIYESLGCGVPVVSEPVSMPDLFPEGLVHYGDTPEALAWTIQAILDMDAFAYRCLADQGFEWAHGRCSYQTRCQELLDAVAKELG